MAGDRYLISGENTNTGTTGRALVLLQNSANTLFVAKYSTGYTSAGIAAAAGSAIYDDGAGGLAIGATHGSGDLRLWSRNALAATFASGGAATFSSSAGVTARGLNLTDGDTIQWTSSSNRVFFNGGAFLVDVNGTTRINISTAGLVTASGGVSTTFVTQTGGSTSTFAGPVTLSSTVQIGTVSTLSQYGNSIYASRNLEWNLTYSAAVANNKDIGFSYVDNTHLRVYMKGSDGVTRSVDLTLA